MTEQQQSVETTEDTPIIIDSVDKFFFLLAKWHDAQVRTLMHIANAPEGIEVKVDEDTPLSLSGDAYKAFRLGIELSLKYLGELPFHVNKSEEDATIH